MKKKLIKKGLNFDIIIYFKEREDNVVNVINISFRLERERVIMLVNGGSDVKSVVSEVSFVWFYVVVVVFKIEDVRKRLQSKSVFIDIDKKLDVFI